MTFTHSIWDDIKKKIGQGKVLTRFRSVSTILEFYKFLITLTLPGYDQNQNGILFVIKHCEANVLITDFQKLSEVIELSQVYV